MRTGMMMTGRTLRHFTLIGAATLLLALSVPCSGWSQAAEPVDNFLPESGFSEKLALSGKIGHYNPENLYTYINGEAELFMPYGFATLSSAFYARGNDPASGIVADIYTMGSPIDAFGIYSNYRDPDAEKIKFGAEGFVDDSQLMLYRDRYFVRLSVSGNLDGGRENLIALAREIHRRLPGKPSSPREISLISIPGVNPGTIRYIAHGVLGYRFFEKGLTADAQIDGETAKVFVIMNGSADKANAALQAYMESLEKAGVAVDRATIAGGAALMVNDPLYKGTCVRRSGAYVFGATKLKDPSKALPVVDRMASRIDAF